MKVQELFEEDKVKGHSTLHSTGVRSLKTHGIKRDEYESQPNAHQSWLRAKDKVFSAGDRSLIAKDLGMKEHPQARALGYGPATSFVNSHSELTFGSEKDAAKKGHYVTLRTAKNAGGKYKD